MFLQFFSKKGFLYVTAFTLMCNPLSKYQNSEGCTGGSITTDRASLLGRSKGRIQSKKQPTGPSGYWEFGWAGNKSIKK
jgi:hypothetical protein